MTKPYKELDLSELKLERARLQHILGNKPKPNVYKQTKKSLGKINNLIAMRVSENLVHNTQIAVL